MVRLGILGAGNIAHRFMKGVVAVKDIRVDCIYARKVEKAEAFAKQYAVKCYTDNFQQFLNHENLDAVYIATPNFLHYEHVMAALRAGLHVMVEKPAFIDVRQAKEALTYAKKHQLILMEAMKVCYLPTTKLAKQWLTEGKIGEVICMEANFCRRSEINLDHPIFDKQKGGGALFDVGCYALAMVRQLLGEPKQIHADFHLCKQGVDDTVELLLSYDGSQWARVQASFLIDQQNAAILYGSEGTITIPEFWKSASMELKRYDGLKESFSYEQSSEFTWQIEYFVDLILGKEEMNEENSGYLNCKWIKEVIERGYD